MPETSRELLAITAVDPGGFSGVQMALVPLVDGALRFGPVEALDKSRALAMTFGTEITDDRWKEHAQLISRGVMKQREWAKGKADEIGYDGYRQVVVVEGFVGGDVVMSGDPFSPVRIHALLDWLLSDVVEEFHSPLPAAKAQITDDRLRRWTWFAKGKPHLNDARRHLFVYLRSLEVSST